MAADHPTQEVDGFVQARREPARRCVLGANGDFEQASSSLGGFFGSEGSDVDPRRATVLSGQGPEQIDEGLPQMFGDGVGAGAGRSRQVIDLEPFDVGFRDGDGRAQDLVQIEVTADFVLVTGPPSHGRAVRHDRSHVRGQLRGEGRVSVHLLDAPEKPLQPMDASRGVIVDAAPDLPVDARFDDEFVELDFVPRLAEALGRQGRQRFRRCAVRRVDDAQESLGRRQITRQGSHDEPGCFAVEHEGGLRKDLLQSVAARDVSDLSAETREGRILAETRAERGARAAPGDHVDAFPRGDHFGQKRCRGPQGATERAKHPGEPDRFLLVGFAEALKQLRYRRGVALSLAGRLAHLFRHIGPNHLNEVRGTRVQRPGPGEFEPPQTASRHEEVQAMP